MFLSINSNTIATLYVGMSLRRGKLIGLPKQKYLLKNFYKVYDIIMAFELFQAINFPIIF